MVIYKRKWADYFEIELLSISHPSGSLNKLLEKKHFICCMHNYLFQEFCSDYWHLSHWKAGFSTFLEVSQNQAFFIDQPLFKCLTRIRRTKAWRRAPVLPSALKEVTPDKYLPNLFLRNFCEGKGFFKHPLGKPSPSFTTLTAEFVYPISKISV